MKNKRKRSRKNKKKKNKKKCRRRIRSSKLQGIQDIQSNRLHKEEILPQQLFQLKLRTTFPKSLVRRINHLRTRRLMTLNLDRAANIST